MKRAKKLLAAALVCLMMISSMVINVSAAEESTFSEVPISATASCTQHIIADRYLTSYISGTATHIYQPSPNVNPEDCTVTTYVDVYSQYCTRCGQSFGNYYNVWDSHSAH